MKKIITLMLVFAMVLTLGLCGCSEKPNLIGAAGDAEPGEILIYVDNEVEKGVAMVSITTLSDGEAVGSVSMTNASQDEEVGKGRIEFHIHEEDIVAEDLTNLSAKISVTNFEGVTTELAESAIPVEMGKAYGFTLRNEDGNLVVEQIIEQ